MALVTNPGKRARATSRNVGDYIKLEPKPTLRGKVGKIYSQMPWGKGVKESNEAIEEILKERQREHRTVQAIIIVSWAGNDVWGNKGFAGCRWIDREAASWSLKRQDAANQLQFERAQAVYGEVEKLGNYAHRKDVAIVAAYAPINHIAFGLEWTYCMRHLVRGIQDDHEHIPQRQVPHRRHRRQP